MRNFVKWFFQILLKIEKKKVTLIRLPVQSKNPLLILINSILISLLILFFNISIVHARSRAPAWSCFLATKITFIKVYKSSLFRVIHM